MQNFNDGHFDSSSWLIENRTLKKFLCSSMLVILCSLGRSMLNQNGAIERFN